MAIAKHLHAAGYKDGEVHPDFFQFCPLCGQSNRIVMKGVHKIGNKVELHPDMGYSFCNCRDIFYTRKENVMWPHSYTPGPDGLITLPDPFFAWPNPYDFHGWDVRRYPILWDMDEYARELESKGFKIVRAWRDMDLDSLTPQCFHIEVSV